MLKAQRVRQRQSGSGSTHLPCSLMRSTRRSTASASGMLNLIGGLADVEVDLAGRAADVAEVRVGHFARAVHDAAHDGDLHALEMLGARFDAAR